MYFHGEERQREWIEEYYPDAVLQDSMTLRQGHFNYSRFSPPVPIDAEIIGALSKYEFACLKLLEDTTGWNFSFDERRQYYYDLLKYWNTMIHHLKPDLYVCFTWPHIITDYTLYLLCKHVYSIDVLFVDPSFVPLSENYYQFVGNSLEDVSLPIRQLYESDEPFEAGDDAKEYLAGIRGKKWAKSPHDGKKTQWVEPKGYQYTQFIRLVYSLLRGRAFRAAPLAIKKNRLPLSSPMSRLTNFDHFWLMRRVRRTNMRLKKIYASFCVQPDFEKKYIYFPAPLQPEANTLTNGRIYDDLFLVLDILSVSIPEDWVIYYKEHWAIFAPASKGSTRRDHHFYEKVKSYKNIHVIPYEMDSFKLIDHSQAVASVTGTSSWEAAVRGKPALFFGNVWYQGCKSLFRISTLKDCQKAMEKIRNGYEPDQRDIERYIAAFEKVAVKGLIHYRFYENIKKCPDPKFEMERIGKALYEAYERHYGT